MSRSEADAKEPAQNPTGKPSEARPPRSIRFSDAEWAGVEKEAKRRGMTAAELVRHAAVGLSIGNLSPVSETLPPEISALMERVYRGVYLLSTLKRDELIREGRQQELERIANAARESQNSILNKTSGTAK